MQIIKFFLTSFLIVYLCFSAVSQDNFHSKIEDNYNGEKLTSFLSNIEARSDLRFFYKDNWINSITIQVPTRGKSIRWVLEKSIADYGLTFIIFQGNNLIFIPNGFTINKDKLSEGMIGYIKVIGNLMEKGKYKQNKVEGTVLAGKTMEPIVGAVVQDKKSGLATTTNADGHYEIMLPIGQTELTFSFIGLETETIKVDVLSPGQLDVELLETSIALEGVTVTSSGGKNRVNRTQLGVEAFDIRTIGKLPVLMGEADIIKSMTLLPGVQTAGEMSTGFNVRGGNVDQNLILLNGAPVYNTSHMFGLFSTFIPSAVSNVELYKSSQPATFGGRVSAVMDIGLKDVDTTKFHGNAGIGVLNSQVFIETPIGKKVGFYIGGRTTYSNWILHKTHNTNIRNSDANFYDFIAKVDFKPAKNHKLDIFGYYADDQFNYNNISKFDYSQQIFGMNYRWLISAQAQFKLSGSYTGYKSILSDIEQETLASDVETGISHIRGKAEVLIAHNMHNINAGVEVNQIKINPGKLIPRGSKSSVLADEVPDENGAEYAAFADDNFAASDRFSFALGLRYSMFRKMGSCTENIYLPDMPRNAITITDSVVYDDGEKVKSYSGLEPRFGVRYKINSNSSIKVGYSYMIQYQQLLSNNTSAMPSDYWKLCDNYSEPLKSHQISAGYFTTMLGDMFDFSTEIYYKTIDNQFDYKNGTTTSMNHYIEQYLLSGKVHSYGIEFMLRKSIGSLTGWLSYTLSDTKMKVDGDFAEEKINNGDYYAASTHHLHDLSITTSYQLTRRWNASANFVLTSGKPITYPEYSYNMSGMNVVHFSEHNKYRLPAYHRLDLSLTYEGNLNKKRHIHPSLTFALYNAYGHKNVYTVFYKKDVPSELNGFHQYGLYKLSIIGVPIPSLTLNLKFW